MMTFQSKNGKTAVKLTQPTIPHVVIQQINNKIYEINNQVKT